MKKYNKLINLIYAIGTQLYNKDKLLLDLFEDRFSHHYCGFLYSPDNKEEVKQLELIKKLRKDYSLIELINMAMQESDYHTLYKFNWWIKNYEEKFKRYNPNEEPLIKSEIIKDTFNNRIEELKLLNLDSWRKSNDKVLHQHYYYWINHLKNDEDVNYTLWVLRYNDTKVIDTFHLSNFGDKRLPNIILQYILDNNIISDQLDNEREIDIINPFIRYDGNNGHKMLYSSDMGGMWYLIYLTAEELQQIYKTIGSKKARDLHVMSFFSYINSLKSSYEKEEKFYLYFKK